MMLPSFLKLSFNTDLPPPKLFILHLLSSELDRLLRLLCSFISSLVFWWVFPCLGRGTGWALQINIMDWMKEVRSLAAVSHPRPFPVPLSYLCSPVVLIGLLPFGSNKDRSIPVSEVLTGKWMMFLWLASGFGNFPTEQTNKQPGETGSLGK